jgi:hypothetical protein
MRTEILICIIIDYGIKFELWSVVCDKRNEVIATSISVGPLDKKLCEIYNPLNAQVILPFPGPNVG